MLDVLSGNKNVQKILLFLLVNGKCYGTQLHRLLKTPLTPLQKTLAKLEEGGVIRSYYEGKTRVYQFNNSHPHLPELEQLLKKIFIHLPPQEKKEYHVQEEGNPAQALPGGTKKILLTFWDKLSQVNKIAFASRSKNKEGWNGKGEGEVRVSKEGNILTFTEKGQWRGKQGEIDFSNVFRWTLDRNQGMISLEHLRHGAENPVFLCHLVPKTPHALVSIDSHLCEEDHYFGQLFVDRYGLRLNWRILGPRKNEEIDYYYC